MNNIMYLTSIASPNEFIYFVPKCEGLNHLKNWLEKSDFKFNLELSEFFELNLELELSSFELVQDFELN